MYYAVSGDGDGDQSLRLRREQFGIGEGTPEYSLHSQGKLCRGH